MFVLVPMVSRAFREGVRSFSRSRTTRLCGARLTGVGSCAPEVVVTNDDLAAIVETSDEWIFQRTGISKRRVMPPSQSLRDLASVAAQNALDSAGVEASEVDLVVLATSSPDDLFGDAATVAARIGAHHAAAFDLTAACSGFLFGVVTASQFLNSRTSQYSTVLVIGADALSRWVDWTDRNTCILFGDGAGAVVMKKSGEEQEDGVLGFALRSNGKDYEYLKLGYDGASRTIDTPEKNTVTEGSYSSVTMDGRQVYKFATREVPVVIQAALDDAGIQASDVDWLLLHQANIRIMETVADRLGLSHDKIISNLAEHGNTSAGSIPLALDAAVKSGQIKSGHTIACAGFGAGLSWGAAVIKWG